jgi:hypothetical protein
VGVSGWFGASAAVGCRSRGTLRGTRRAGAELGRLGVGGRVSPAVGEHHHPEIADDTGWSCPHSRRFTPARPHDTAPVRPVLSALRQQRAAGVRHNALSV